MGNYIGIEGRAHKACSSFNPTILRHPRPGHKHHWGPSLISYASLENEPPSSCLELSLDPDRPSRVISDRG